MAEVNIVLNILETLKEAKPDSTFVVSLYNQFCNIGGLSKKQLEGLYTTAENSGLISGGKLATLQAIIKKKPTRYKSEVIKDTTVVEKDNSIELMLNQILEKYPQHKMALFLHSKCKHNDVLSETEISEVKRLNNVLLKK